MVAEEEVTKIIDQLVLEPKVAADLKASSDFTRLQVVKSLGKEIILLFILFLLFIWETFDKRVIRSEGNWQLPP